MGNLIYLAGPIGCAVLMGAMMWMMRDNHAGTRQQPPEAKTQEEISALRAEIAALHERQDMPAGPGPSPTATASLPAPTGIPR